MVDLKLSEPQHPRVITGIDWDNIDSVTQSEYVRIMEDNLDNLNIPDILHGNKMCDDSMHIGCIESYYNEIVNCIRVADEILPRRKPGTRKDYWNAKLSSLKHDSIVAHDLWKLSDRPTNGPVFDAKKSAYFKYKLFLRK